MKKGNKTKGSEVKNSRARSNRVLIGSLILAGMTSVGIYAMASADENGGARHDRNYSPERHERMEKAFKNNDYDSWKAEMDKNERKGRAVEVVNKDNFSKFSKMHELREEGKTEEADKIREELGLHGRGNGEGHGRGMGKDSEHHGEHRNDDHRGDHK